MDLEKVGEFAAAGSKNSGDKIWRVQDGSTIIYVADLTQVADEVVISRGRLGNDKEGMFRKATGRALELLADPLKLVHGWMNGGVVEYSILRGASHVRPENVQNILGCRVEYSAERWHRVRDGNGGWVATPKDGTAVNLEAAWRAKTLLVWEGCTAGGSTFVGNMVRFREHNPNLRHCVVVCPIAGDLGYLRLRDTAARLGIGITFICFGIYKVMPIGWKDKPDTDIVIPGDHKAGALIIPGRQANAYRDYYHPKGEDGRGPCLINDMGTASSGDSKDLLEYAQESVEELPEYCESTHALAPLQAYVRTHM